MNMGDVVISHMIYGVVAHLNKMHEFSKYGSFEPKL